MDTLIEARGLKKEFFPTRSLRDVFSRGGNAMVRAVDGVDLSIARGESVGLVGESGSGKTTLGRMILKLTPISGGTLRFDGDDVTMMDAARTRRYRGQAQLVFQNPFDALNPRFTVARAIGEPLVNTGVARADRPARIEAALRLVHLPADETTLQKYPHQMSGGQLQRVVLARALVLKPIFLIADEPVSMLDVSVRAGVLNLLRDVRDALGLTALYISHDLALVRYVCVRTMVLYAGAVVEDGPTETVIRHPGHPYTRALIAAVPRPHVDQPRDPLPIRPGGIAAPGGCRFRARCPHAFARCDDEIPALREIAPGHYSACHLHEQAAA